MWARLNDAPCPEDASPLRRWWFHDYPFRGAVSREYPELWEKYRAEILERWTHKRPGTRPSFWWHYDAPQFTPKLMAQFESSGWGSLEGCQIPRERAGGAGRRAEWE